ncbi:hypothetical protein C2G38_2223037 [Gigaspora rosea]|uniref:Uncharacterized protein n=1 Tax=Gigaspora rosea TaxID=44941 RepID=A0A397U1V6_9GLOM|nr:hypothetical protein C2G38_2223037 [Gigaspora rosea]
MKDERNEEKLYANDLQETSSTKYVSSPKFLSSKHLRLVTSLLACMLNIQRSPRSRDVNGVLQGGVVHTLAEYPLTLHHTEYYSGVITPINNILVIQGGVMSRPHQYGVGYTPPLLWIGPSDCWEELNIFYF